MEDHLCGTGSSSDTWPVGEPGRCRAALCHSGTGQHALAIRVAAAANWPMVAPHSSGFTIPVVLRGHGEHGIGSAILLIAETCHLLSPRTSRPGRQQDEW